MNALAKRPSICGATRSTSTPLSARNVRASSIWYTRQGSISISSKPDAVSLPTYSFADFRLNVRSHQDACVRMRMSKIGPRDIFVKANI
jgi:hypothetical protein